MPKFTEKDVIKLIDETNIQHDELFKILTDYLNNPSSIMYELAKPIINQSEYTEQQINQVWEKLKEQVRQFNLNIKKRLYSGEEAKKIIRELKDKANKIKESKTQYHDLTEIQSGIIEILQSYNINEHQEWLQTNTEKLLARNIMPIEQRATLLTMLQNMQTSTPSNTDAKQNSEDTSNTDQDSINDFLKTEQWEKLQINIDDLLGKEARENMIDQILKNHNNTKVKILQDEDPTEFLEFIAKLETLEKYFRDNNLQDIADFLKKINQNMEQTLSVKEELQALSNKYETKEIDSNKLWASVISANNLKEFNSDDPKTIQARNENITITKKEHGSIHANLNSLSPDSLLEGVNIMRNHCSQAHEKTIILNITDLNATQRLFELFVYGSPKLECVLGKDARDFLEKQAATDPIAKNCLENIDQNIKDSILEWQQELKNEKDIFPETKEFDIDMNESGIDSVRNILQTFSALKEKDLLETEYELNFVDQHFSITDEIFTKIILVTNAQKKINDLLEQRQHLVRNKINSVKDNNNYQELLLLKNTDEQLKIQIDDARNDLYKKWKEIKVEFYSIKYFINNPVRKEKLKQAGYFPLFNTKDNTTVGDFKAYKNIDRDPEDPENLGDTPKHKW